MGRAANSRKQFVKARSASRYRRCPSGKAWFPDEISAKLFIARKQWQDKNDLEKTLARPYHHRVCNGWHITSQSQEEYEARKKEFQRSA